MCRRLNEGGGGDKGVARWPSQNGSFFDEALEKKWVEQWLFYANATRMASAMAGTEYGVFVNGRWNLSRNIQDMIDWLHFKLNEIHSSTDAH